MSQKLNLALLIKKQEEMRKQEMEAINAGRANNNQKMVANATSCRCAGVLMAADNEEYGGGDNDTSCNCGSLWVVMGLYE